MTDRSRSLWLSRSKKPVKVALRERFGGYPYFVEAFDQYVELKVPDVVVVRWDDLKKYLEVIEGDEDEVEQHEAWIQTVKEMIREGHDVPPLLLDGKRLFDGRHRAWAAHELGMRKAPVVDIHPYWK